MGKQNKTTFVASGERKSRLLRVFLSRTLTMSGPPFGVTPGEGCKFHLLAIGIAMALILRGGGKWSVDTAISLAQRTMIDSTGLRRGESSRAI